MDRREFHFIHEPSHASQVAKDWRHLAEVPKIRKLLELDEIGREIEPEHFQGIYNACESARFPLNVACGAEAWWQAFVVVAMTTGWRVGDLLAFRRDDLDLATGRILTRAKNNKAGRDGCDYLVPAALERVKRIASFDPHVVPWPPHRTTLWTIFREIQQDAGISLPCPDRDEHECTDSCRYYGFHSLRRGYATLNADSMPAPVLQKKMRHARFSTTLRYIALSDKLKKATDAVPIPEFLTSATGN